MKHFVHILVVLTILWRCEIFQQNRRTKITPCVIYREVIQLYVSQIVVQCQCFMLYANVPNYSNESHFCDKFKLERPTNQELYEERFTFALDKFAKLTKNQNVLII